MTRYNENIEKDWLEKKYIMEQLSKQQIANILNCSYGCIHNHLIKFNIPIRSRKEALKIDANRPEKIEYARNKMLGDKNIIHLPGVRQRVGRDVSGEKNPNWKISSERKTWINTSVRQSLKYKEWRNMCFQRDDYTCQNCGGRGVRLHVDHIRPFALILKENNIDTVEKSYECETLWDLENGRTLCIDCHKKTDTFAGLTNNLLRGIS